MTHKIDEIFKRVLNDEDIFNSPYDRKRNNLIPKLFERDSWKNLAKLFSENEKDQMIRIIGIQIKTIQNQERNANKWRRNKITELIRRAGYLISAINNKPALLKILFQNLEWYGLAKCYLPNMDEYGKIIEEYNKSIINQYFLYKISKEKNYEDKQSDLPTKRKALEKILCYIEELYNSGINSIEIAFFVRKINSLETFWELLI